PDRLRRRFRTAWSTDSQRSCRRTACGREMANSWLGPKDASAPPSPSTTSYRHSSASFQERVLKDSSTWEAWQIRISLSQQPISRVHADAEARPLPMMLDDVAKS